MKTGLNKRVTISDIFEPVNVNVFDIETKKIVFNGGLSSAAKFLNMRPGHLHTYMIRKINYKRKYAIRYAKNNI